jgi:hypothetical protein
MVLAQDMSAATASSQEAAARSDSQIEMDVVHALDASQALKNDLITAATIQAEVTLSGTVSSESSRKLAASLAGQAQGVTKVHNNLLVGNPQQAANASDQQGADKQAEENAVQPAPEAVQPAILSRRNPAIPRPSSLRRLIRLHRRLSLSTRRISPTRLNPAIPRPRSLRGPTRLHRRGSLSMCPHGLSPRSMKEPRDR